MTHDSTGERVAKWTVLLTAVDYIILVPSILFAFYIISNLGPNDYGIFVIASAPHQFIVTLLQSFFVSPSIRLIALHYGQKNNAILSKIMGLIMSVVFLVSLSLVFVYVLLTPVLAIDFYHRPFLIAYMFILAPIILIGGFDSFLRGVLLGFSDFKKIAIVRISEVLFLIICVLSLVYFLSWTVYAVVYGTLISTTLKVITSLILVKRKLKTLDLKIMLNLNTSHLKEIMQMGKYFTIGDILYNTFLRIDIMILPLFVSNTLIAFYNFAKSIVIKLGIFAGKLNMLLYPTFSEKSSYTDKTYIRSLLGKGIAFSFLYSIPLSIFLAVFPREIILFLSYFINLTEYLDASIYISVFSLMIIGQTAAAIIVAYFNGIGRVENLAKANVILTGSAIVLIPLLTYSFSALGTSVAYISAHYLTVIFWIYLASKESKIDLMSIGKILLTSAVIAIIIKAFIGLLFFDVPSIMLVIYFILFTVFYFVAHVPLLIITNTLTIDDIILLKQLGKKNKLIIYLLNILERIHIRLRGGQNK